MIEKYKRRCAEIDAQTQRRLEELDRYFWSVLIGVAVFGLIGAVFVCALAVL